MADTKPEAPQQPSVGDAVKGTQNGSLEIGTVKHILDVAPKDLVEEVLPVPEWDCAVRVKSFTSAQSAMVRQRGFGYKGEEMQVAWAEMEILQFQLGVIEPRFEDPEVRQLHASSGRGFQRIIQWLDEQSKIDKEALRDARQEFPAESGPEA